MRNKSVAVLDVRSGEITAAIAEKGVNGTFIIKSKYTVNYDGYAEGELLDVDGFIRAVKEAAGNTIASVEAPVKEFFISLPCEFTQTVITDKVISFPFSQKITKRHIGNLVDISVPRPPNGMTVVKWNPLYYVLSDKRKVSAPLDSVSDSLRAKLGFIMCKTSFMDCIMRAFKPFSSVKIFRWIPQNYALTHYLFNDERDGYSVLFDIGYISSTFCVAYGNGVAFSEAFSIGVGHIALLLCEALDVPFDAAMQILKTVNLNARDRATSNCEVMHDGQLYAFKTNDIAEVIREGLDGVCETVEACRQAFSVKDIGGVTINVTGEGVGVVRGMLEHLSSRLVTPVEAIAPKVPYYDKPRYSSLFSLLAVALAEKTR